MSFLSCARESELKRVLELGHWPHASPTELRTHVDRCRPCQDLLLVAHAFRTARSISAASARLNTPGLLWWRAQIRRRNEATQRIDKPILGANLFALCLNLLILAALAASQARNGLQWIAIQWASRWPNARSGSGAAVTAVGHSAIPRVPDAATAHAFHFDSLWSVTTLWPTWNMNALVPYILPTLVLLTLFTAVALFLSLEGQE